MTRAKASSLHLWHLDAIGLTVCAALTVVGYQFTFKPIAAARTQYTAMQAELGALQQQSQQVKSSQQELSDELNTIRDKVDGSPVQLQPAKTLNLKISHIVDVASASGMQIHETQAGDIVRGTWYQTVPIKVSGRGSYSSCARFLHQLYGSLPDVEVLSFGINGAPAATGSASTFQFELAWYAAPLVASAE